MNTAQLLRAGLAPILTQCSIRSSCLIGQRSKRRHRLGHQCIPRVLLVVPNCESLLAGQSRFLPTKAPPHASHSRPSSEISSVKFDPHVGCLLGQIRLSGSLPTHWRDTRMALRRPPARSGKPNHQLAPAIGLATEPCGESRATD